MKKSHLLLFGMIVGMLAPIAVVRADSSPQFDVDGFIDTLDAFDIGERTAYTPAGGFPIPPTPALIGPISNGTVSGQFEFTCATQAGCADAAFAAANFNWKWAVLEVNDSSTPVPLDGAFVEVAGVNLFPAAGPNEGFTTIDTVSFNGKDPFARLAHFEFTLQSVGVTLQPGLEYIFAAFLTAESQTLPTRVPGEGAGFAGFAEESVFFSSVTDAPPHQFHQSAPDAGIFPDINQVVTSRLIPIVPEPASGVMLLIGLGALGRRNRRCGRR